MERNEEDGRITKKDFDSLCPYCKSRAIFRIGERRSIAHDFCWNSDTPQAGAEAEASDEAPELSQAQSEPEPVSDSDLLRRVRAELENILTLLDRE